VFNDPHGKALDAANVRKMFKRVCTVAGIGDGWTLRELRPVTGPEVMDDVFGFVLESH
jgi:hypothetical protein